MERQVLGPCGSDLSMRDILVILFMLGVVIYAQRDWVMAVCALIVFTALKDYPNLANPLEAKGLNHWVVMFLGIMLAWGMARFGRRITWNVPKSWLWIIGIYLACEGVATVRLLIDVDAFREKAIHVKENFYGYGVQAALVDRVYVPGRYMLVGALLLLDGVRSRRTMQAALLSVFLFVLVQALIVAKQIPLSSLRDGGMQVRHRIMDWTGRHPNDLARDVVALFWVAVIYVAQFKLHRWKWRALVILPSLALVICLAQTYSRGGIVGFIACGLAVMIVARSWSCVGVMAAGAAAVVALAPSLLARILAGVDTSGMGYSDMGEITAGRDLIWPAALQGIAESPLIGHGLYGYVLSSALDNSLASGGAEVHPHNAYLQALLDVGVLGLLPRLGPFLYVLWAGAWLAWKRQDPLLRLTGVAGVSVASTTFAMGLTGQHFGFTENLFIFWCVAGLVVRGLTLPDATVAELRARSGALVHTRRHAWPAHVRPVT